MAYWMGTVAAVNAKTSIPNMTFETLGNSGFNINKNRYFLTPIWILIIFEPQNQSVNKLLKKPTLVDHKDINGSANNASSLFNSCHILDAAERFALFSLICYRTWYDRQVLRFHLFPV